jgi:transcription elongation GreA/GreB family factor
MTKTTNIKQAILTQIMAIIGERIDSAKQAIASAKESRDNETKSSVGDKYETGRAMMQMELEKNRVQLNKALKIKNELEQISPHKKYDKVEFGSLVLASNGIYFISTAIGKLVVEEKTIYSISLASPIGRLLYNQKAGDKFKFQGKEITILEIG